MDHRVAAPHRAPCWPTARARQRWSSSDRDQRRAHPRADRGARLGDALPADALPQPGGRRPVDVVARACRTSRMPLRATGAAGPRADECHGAPVIWPCGRRLRHLHRRFAVTTGGVLDDFFVTGTSLRGDPARPVIAQRGLRPRVLGDSAGCARSPPGPGVDGLRTLSWPMRGHQLVGQDAPSGCGRCGARRAAAARVAAPGQPDRAAGLPNGFTASSASSGSGATRPAEPERQESRQKRACRASMSHFLRHAVLGSLGGRGARTGTAMCGADHLVPNCSGGRAGGGWSTRHPPNPDAASTTPGGAWRSRVSHGRRRCAPASGGPRQGRRDRLGVSARRRRSRDRGARRRTRSGPARCRPPGPTATSRGRPRAATGRPG